MPIWFFLAIPFAVLAVALVIVGLFRLFSGTNTADSFQHSLNRLAPPGTTPVTPIRPPTRAAGRVESPDVLLAQDPRTRPNSDQ